MRMKLVVKFLNNVSWKFLSHCASVWIFPDGAPQNPASWGGQVKGRSYSFLGGGRLRVARTFSTIRATFTVKKQYFCLPAQVDFARQPRIYRQHRQTLPCSFAAWTPQMNSKVNRPPGQIAQYLREYSRWSHPRSEFFLQRETVVSRVAGQSRVSAVASREAKGKLDPVRAYLGASTREYDIRNIIFDKGLGMFIAIGRHTAKNVTNGH